MVAGELNGCLFSCAGSCVIEMNRDNELDCEESDDDGEGDGL
jgi:hypothetical protein